MLFNSFDYAIFLPIVFFVYWFLVQKSLKAQNLFLLVASYVFYGWWDYRFLSLIFISTIVDFVIGQKIANAEGLNRKRLFLRISLLANLGLLGFFKYYNFFVESWVGAFSTLGIDFAGSTINVILPVGISFYTFQTMSYSLDIYRGQLKPTNDFISFAAFVSFFPQLVAGPIERASNLLPQILNKRSFDLNEAKDGLRQILVGLFKKVVLADNLARFVNMAFGEYADLSGSTLLVGSIFFSFQIYADFSGYSDIAIGTARLFGVKLMTNFRYPFFSRSIPEFWRRWHISLNTWLNDYVFLPLSIRFRYWHKWGLLLAAWITFGLSGIWHGAGWNYIAFGLIHALYLTPTVLFGRLSGIGSKKLKKKDSLGGGFISLIGWGRMLFTFCLANISLIFFRARTIEDGWNYLAGIFDRSVFTLPQGIDTFPVLFLGLLIVGEWLQREREHMLDFTSIRVPVWLRWSIYYGIIFLLILFGGEPVDFIYFQF